MMTTAEYDTVFKLPFTEAAGFFRRKLNIPTKEWTDLELGEHAKGFMSAGAYNADLLADLRKITQKAIDGGMDIREFRKAFRPLVEKYGWELKGGGPGWRADLIFRTNISTAYAAGRWQQFEAAGIKYLRYVHADGVRHPRPKHLAMHGTVRLIGDAFWGVNYPPQGFRCHCRAEAVTQKEYDATPDQQKQLPPGWKDAADPGWAYNVGKEANRWNPNLDRYDYDIARELVKGLPQEKLFKTWHDFARATVTEELKKPEYSGLSNENLIKRLRTNISNSEKYPVAVLPPEIKTKIGAQTQGVYLSHYDLIKQQVSRQGQNFEAMEYAKAQDTLESVKLLVQEGEYLHLFAADLSGKWYVAVLQTTETGEGVFLKSFRRSNSKDVASQKKQGTVLIDKT